MEHLVCCLLTNLFLSQLLTPIIRTLPLVGNIALYSSVHFSRSVVPNSLRPHESQHARPPCPSPTPGVHSDSCPSSQWCHPAISSSVVPFSSCPQSLPASESLYFTTKTKIPDQQKLKLLNTMCGPNWVSWRGGEGRGRGCNWKPFQNSALTLKLLKTLHPAILLPSMWPEVFLWSFYRNVYRGAIAIAKAWKQPKYWQESPVSSSHGKRNKYVLV